MSKEFTKPLTPALRQYMKDQILEVMKEIEGHDPEQYVSVRMKASFCKYAVETAINLINALPDGYPVPMSKD